MTRTEIKAALACDYRRAYTVYESMEKQATIAIHHGQMEAYKQFKKKAALRSATLFGMKRAAAVLGIDEVEFMEAVNADKE